MMYRILILLIMAAFPRLSAAESSTTAKGLHTANRMLLPADNSQSVNFLLHRNQPKKATIDAPLVTIEQVAVPDKKYKINKLRIQTNLASPGLDLE
jgi:hypothetical protein